MKDEIGDKQFFITPAHPCSYMPNRQAHTVFLDPRETITPATYQLLTERGFRRSGGHVYRPQCRSCRACVPTRIAVDEFNPRRSQRRVARRNDDLQFRVETAKYAAHYYALYARYVAGRHRDGDMYPPSQDQFRSFLLSQWSDTLFATTYLDGRLVSVAVTDRQEGGLSAIYTFFDPSLAARSLGVLSILKQIELCREMELPYLYLGYWIAESAKMRYKTEYRPVELFIDGRWVRIN